MAINPNFMGSNSPSGPTSTGKNMLEQAEELKGWPDQRLMQEYNSPTTATPQVVVLAELNRRADMRNRYQQQMANQPEQPPVDDQVMAKLMGMQPPQGGPPQGGPPQGGPPQGGPPGMPPGGPGGPPPGPPGGPGGPPPGMPPGGPPPGMPPGPGGPPPGMPPRPGGPPMARPGGPAPGRPPMGPMPPRGMALGGLIKRYDNGGVVEEESITEPLVPWPGPPGFRRRGNKPKHLTGSERHTGGGDSAKSILEELLGIRLRNGGVVRGYQNGGLLSGGLKGLSPGMPMGSGESRPQPGGIPGGLSEEDYIRYRILQGKSFQELTDEELEWMNKITRILSSGPPRGMGHGGRVRGYANGGMIPPYPFFNNDEDVIERYREIAGAAPSYDESEYTDAIRDMILSSSGQQKSSLSNTWEAIQKSKDRQRDIDVAMAMLKGGAVTANQAGPTAPAIASGLDAFADAYGPASRDLTADVMEADLQLNRDDVSLERARVDALTNLEDARSRNAQSRRNQAIQGMVSLSGRGGSGGPSNKELNSYFAQLEHSLSQPGLVNSLKILSGLSGEQLSDAKNALLETYGNHYTEEELNSLINAYELRERNPRGSIMYIGNFMQAGSEVPGPSTWARGRG